jgi:DNA repair protein RecO (recombination protein O)
MSATKTQAYILKTQDYRDTSILGDFYTRDFGKIKGIVRGVRDARGRYGSTLEPFSLNEILFYKRRRGGDLHQVTQVELVSMFPEVREDMERLSYASYFIQLVNELVEVEDANPRIFDLLSDALRFLSSSSSPKRCARIFEVKLFALLGLMPEIGMCVSCQKTNPDPAYFNVALGGIHCKGCRADQTSFPVSKGTLNFMEHVRRSELQGLHHVKVAQEVGEELQKILRRFVDFHLTNKLKSVVFMEKMGY